MPYVEGTRDGCILGKPIRRRPVLPVLVPPRRPAVRCPDPTRPWYGRVLDSTGFSENVFHMIFISFYFARLADSGDCSKIGWFFDVPVQKNEELHLRSSKPKERRPPSSILSTEIWRAYPSFFFWPSLFGFSQLFWDLDLQPDLWSWRSVRRSRSALYSSALMLCRAARRAASLIYWLFIAFEPMHLAYCINLVSMKTKTNS